MKYKEDTNINIISIGEKLEHYLRGCKDNYIGEGDIGYTVILYYSYTFPYFCQLHFVDDGSNLSIDIAVFNKREQDYIENTTDKIQFTIGRKVEGC